MKIGKMFLDSKDKFKLGYSGISVLQKGQTDNLQTKGAQNPLSRIMIGIFLSFFVDNSSFGTTEVQATRDPSSEMLTQKTGNREESLHQAPVKKDEIDSVLTSQNLEKKKSNDENPEQKIEPTLDQKQVVIREAGFNSTSKIIINADKIRQSRAPNLTSLLATNANISVSNSALQPGSLFFRGGDSSHILILVDGLPFYDPSTVQRSMNLNQFDLKSIRRIEIIKGSQSVVYGGQALAGVIKIETIPVEIEPLKTVQLEAGNLSYGRSQARVHHPLNDQQGLVGGIQLTGKANKSPILDSKETYWNKNVGGDLAFVHRGVEWEVFGKTILLSDRNQLIDSDYSTYLPIDTKTYSLETENRSINLGFLGKKIALQPKVNIGYQQTERHFLNRPTVDQFYRSEAFHFREENTFFENSQYQLIGGIGLTQEKFIYQNSSIEAVNAKGVSQGLYLKGSQKWTDFLFEVGGRLESIAKEVASSDSVNDLSYHIGLTWKDLVKAEYGTAFKAPSLFQKYAEGYGNPDLQFENAKTASLGIDVVRTDLLRSGLTFFRTEFKNLITSQNRGSGLKFYNVAEAEVRGLEWQSSLNVEKTNRFDLSIGYQEPRDKSQNRWLLKRTLQNQSLRWTRTSNVWTSTLEWSHIGERVDSSGSGGKVTSIEPYSLINVALSLKVSDDLTSYIRIQNLLNHRYEDSYGYYSEGCFAYLGIESQF